MTAVSIGFFDTLSSPIGRAKSLYKFAQASSALVLRTAPHQSGLRPASFPKGKPFCS